MSLSVIEDRDGKPIAILAANAIHFIGPVVSVTGGARLEFEILEKNASRLPSLIGARRLFAIGADYTFWGRLISLEPCTSTHPGLGLLRHEPTLRGALVVDAMLEDGASSH
jgi:hypothetical protein